MRITQFRYPKIRDLNLEVTVYKWMQLDVIRRGYWAWLDLISPDWAKCAHTRVHDPIRVAPAFLSSLDCPLKSLRTCSRKNASGFWWLENL